MQLLAEEMTVQQFDYLVETLTEKGYDHYELSSFAFPVFVRPITLHIGKETLFGIGPSAHSYFQNQRSWNVSNNKLYINKLNAGERL